jgi:predicted negative regulator of RcsB-dependent stress response
MASLDLQEQEQLDNLKDFWKKWGGLIQGVTAAVLLAVAGWNGWGWYQREQGLKASTAYEGVEQAVEAKEFDKAARLVAEMQSRFAKATYTTQATLLVAPNLAADKALAQLQWAATQGEPAELRELANLRLSGLHLEAQRFNEAKAALEAVKSPAFAALVADRRGDLALLQKDTATARKEFSQAYALMDAELPYRRLVEAKLMSVGVDPASVKKAEEAK